MSITDFLSPEWLVLYLALGTLVGFMSGLLGVGGGGILVPLLATIFSSQGVEQSVHLSLGTALMCMIITSAASTYSHHARGAVEWSLMAKMAPGIMMGALLVTQFASQLDAVYIAIFFAAFMALVAIQMFVGWKPPVSKAPIKGFSLFGVGLGIGSFSALAAVGAGFLSVLYLSYKNISFRHAIATSAAIGLPMAVAGALGYLIGGWSKTSDIPYAIGYIYLPAFVLLVVGSLIAAPLGVRLSHHLPSQHLKKIFGIVSLLLSVKMLVSVF